MSEREVPRGLLARLSGGLHLSNWPFAVKMAFCPTLAMLGLVGMSAYGIVAAREQAALIDAVVNRDLVTATRLSTDAAELQAINGGLYRLTTLQASRTGVPGVGAQVDHLVERADALADLLERHAEETAAAERARLEHLAGDVRVYRDAIDVFGSMLEIDFPSAVEFIHPFDDHASRVLREISVIAAHVVGAARDQAQTSMGLAERISLLFTTAAVSGALILFGLSALLTRWTVAGVRRIATATERVALGGGVVDIRALSRGDELGTIVRSLGVFQENIVKIAFLAHHDPLTRLPNRVLFHERVHQLLASSGGSGRFAVLCLDLDRFKAVNDTLGHPVGDALLCLVADRLRGCVRDDDTVARLGGDEFAIVLPDLHEAEAVDALTARIIRSVSSEYEIEGHQISIGTSIGVALSPIDGGTSHELLKNADTALYGAKSAGRGTACFYEASMNASLQSRRALEMGLRQAILRGELVLHYQPLVDAATHRVLGFEALIRWRHPERGLVPPDEFVPIAEACGLIVEIGRWTLRQACLDAQSWPGEAKVAVNLSPLQFKDKALVDTVKEALRDSGLAAHRLELEITESVLLNDSEAVLACLQQVKTLGVQIAMDDFGTGYSSLSYLRSFPFDKVKIDRSFVRDLPHDASAIAIVRAVVGLSEAFGISVVAEGVETLEQARHLAREDCGQLQGYLFSRPVPPDQVARLFDESREELLQRSFG